MNSIDGHLLSGLLHDALRRRSGLSEDEWQQECAKGRIPGSKLLATQADVSGRTVGRALRAKPGDGTRIRTHLADQLLQAAGYGPETLHEIAPLEFPCWAYGISCDCLHVDPEWGI